MRTVHALVVASIMVACGGSQNAVVGGDCAPGFTPCGEGCCSGSAAEPPSAASTPTSSSSPSSSSSSSSGGSGPAPTAPDSSDAGVLAVDASIADDASPPADGGGGGGNVCAAPTVDCGAGCVDLRTDPQNCGACGAFCASGSCVAGVCQGAVPGHAVLIGNDYVAAGSPGSHLSSQERLLGNAALLAPAGAVRVLAFETFADATASANVRSILAKVAAEAGRSITVQATSDVTSVRRSDAEVLLVLDQKNAAGRFAALASSARDPLDRFLGLSGIVVVLDGATAGTEMTSFVNGAGLFDVTDHVVPKGSFVTDARDALAVSVATPFVARADATGFALGSAAPLPSVAVADSDGVAIVLHAAR